MKRFITIVMAAVLMLTLTFAFTGCEDGLAQVCENCGKEVTYMLRKVDKGNGDWINVCTECQKSLNG